MILAIVDPCLFTVLLMTSDTQTLNKPQVKHCAQTRMFFTITACYPLTQWCDYIFFAGQ